jgi:radical SAM protein with 4Fe4S-binding SPASM domain
MNTLAPIIQQHELTSKCNNNCGFCYNPERCWSKISIPRQEDVRRNLEIAKLSVAKGVMAVCLTGGEPFLMGEHLFDVLQIYQKADCYTSINSNGRLITKTIAARLAETGLNSALISIHGIGEHHNDMVGINTAYDETLTGIKNLLAAGIRVIPNFVATAKNVQQLSGVGALLKSIGLKSMTATPFLPSWAAPEHEQFIMQQNHYRDYFKALEEIDLLGLKIDSTLPIPPCVLIKFFPTDWEQYLKVLSPRVCMAGKSFGVISPDGFFRSCIQAPYLKEYGGQVIENYECSWQNANTWAEQKLLPEECLNCKALAICGGGCRTSCLHENNGSAKGKTMYMGKPLLENEAAQFINRTEVKKIVLSTNAYYEWIPQIKVRNEKWGQIIFNPENQSFCLISSDFKRHPQKFPLIMQDQHVAKVLLSVGAIKPIDKNDNRGVLVSEKVKILSANFLFPRLAMNMNSDKIYQLRADTGERLFF